MHLGLKVSNAGTKARVKRCMVALAPIIESCNVLTAKILARRRDGRMHVGIREWRDVQKRSAQWIPE